MNSQEDVFAKFYLDEHVALLTFLYRRGASWEDAWDVVQETFAKALRYWGGLANPRAWLRVTAWRDYVKQQAGKRDEAQSFAREAHISRDQLVNFHLEDEEKQVYEAIAGLPPRQREVMAWYYDGYKVGEIAEILEISPELVRSNLRHARKRLKQLLQVPTDDLDLAPKGGVQRERQVRDHG